MSDRNFMKMLEAQWSRDKFVCVGLDSEFERIPEFAHNDGDEHGTSVTNTIVAFNQAIVEATKDLVCAYKPNIAFYAGRGLEGLSALIRTTAYIRKYAPEVPIIIDAKRADIGTTNTGYVKEAFDILQVDAITVSPYLGSEALKPFLERKEKGIIVLCRTSNPGAGEFQDLHTLTLDPSARPEDMTAESWLEELRKDSMRLYERVAFNVATEWNERGNCLLVVGATYPIEAKEIRVKVGDVPFLLPGIGAQGGDVEATVMASKDSRGWGMTINSSRGIIFASEGADFAEAARYETKKLHDAINQHR